MSGDVFFKLTGSGNDFVFLDGRWASAASWPAERIRRVCARRTGVGADGLVILSPGSRPGAVRFTFFNSDGSPADMCGNAALCAARLAAILELAPGEGMTLETGAGAVEARCVPGSDDRSELTLPPVSGVRSPEIAMEAGERRIGLAVVGVPHLVVELADLASLDVPARGKALRYAQALAPHGANINFVAETGDGWAMRTYERGVEAETLACGTGAVACAAILGRLVADQPSSWTVRTWSDRDLQVSGTTGDPHLIGEGRLVYRGALGPSY